LTSQRNPTIFTAHSNQLMSKKNKQKQQNPPQSQKPTIETVPPVVEEYVPSVNADKYPPKEETGVFKYKILTFRNDYIRLQEEIEDHLNDGWELAGGVSTAFHADAYSTLNMFSQAIVKKF